ncbi:hypothetical protein PENTCL1PPCAC_15617, partial [Pristionchus entomophagus]
FQIGPVFGDVFYRTCKRVLDEPGLIDRMHEEQFDVMITENFDVCGIGITKSIAPKSVIGVSSTSIIGWQFSDWGVPQALSYRPTSMTSSLDVHSLFDRMYNIYGEILGRLIFWYYRQAVTSALKEKFGPDHPTISELSSNVAYVFTNSEPLISSAAPTISRVIEIGGIRAKQPKMLDEYWEGILTQLSKAVLLSFGSIAKSSRIPHAMKMGIIKAMTRIPNVTFIWKYEEPDDDFCKEHATKVDNLVLTKWMPQVDLLAHPNMAAFITHGGMGSTQEIAQRGVPGIFIPLFADQPYNAEMMQLNGLGRVFDKHELHDDEKLAETISDVIDNPKYQFNAKRTSAMLAKKPFTSRELLIKHVEFAAEFGPSSALRPQSLDMKIIEYNNIDIIACVLLSTAIVIYLIFNFTKRIAGNLSTFVKTKAE